MSLSGRQQRLLRGIDKAICRSDPHLASMLAIFGRLGSGEDMPRDERLQAPLLIRVRTALATLATGAALLITRAAGTCGGGLRGTATLCGAMACQLARHASPGGAPSTTSCSPSAGPGPDQPGPPGR
jgi:hypothetical protein